MCIMYIKAYGWNNCFLSLKSFLGVQKCPKKGVCDTCHTYVQSVSNVPRSEVTTLLSGSISRWYL